MSGRTPRRKLVKCASLGVAISVVLLGCGGISPSGGRPNEDTSSLDASCRKSETVEASLRLGSQVSFVADVKWMITHKCGGCHNPAAAANTRREPYLVDYDVAKKYASSMIERMERVGEGVMPPRGAVPGVVAQDLVLLKDWVSGGYLKDPPLPSIDPLKPVYYEPEIRMMMESQCVRCHQAGLQYPYLTSYQDVKLAAERSKIRIDAGTMPSEGSLPNEYKAAFTAWITGGKKNSPDEGVNCNFPFKTDGY